MSNYRAIGVVTAALRNRLSTVSAGVLSGATVTTLRPDVSGSGLPNLGVNIFLYQVTPNAALRNADLPTRRADGSVIRHPAAALNLHYLLSFYGNDLNFETQILLGGVVGNLHAEPALSRAEIGQVFSASALGQAGAGGVAGQGDQTVSELTIPNQAAGFDPSGLADAIDLVRFTPTDLSLEEMSKLWSVFLDTPYVLSVLYQAGPVLIEDSSDTLTAAPLPVMLPARVRAIAGPAPALEQVVPATGAGTPILATSTLTITGTFATGVSTRVLIDGAVALQLTLPASTARPSISGVPIPKTLVTGVHSIQVVQQLPNGPGGTVSPPISSNLAAFVLQPAITPTLDPATAATTRTINVAVTPNVAAHQTVRLLLNLLGTPPAGANPSGAYVLEVPAPQAAGTASFSFATKGLAGGDPPAGTYLVRIEIDGVESAPTFTPPPASGAPAGRTGFTAPTVVLA